MNIGTEFEEELANELGLKRVGGSGNGWSSKLDIRGRATRWSLKATDESGFRVDGNMLKEAVLVCESIGGTGETPIWAVRVKEGDFIIQRAEDWIRFMKDGEFSIPASKSEQRKARSKVPQLLRGQDG